MTRLRKTPPEPPAHPQGELRDGFKFRSGSLALDLPATLAGRLRAEPKDLLATPRDLGRWLVAAGLAPRILEVEESALRDAGALREVLYRLALATARGESLAAKDRALINRWAAEPPPAPQLGPSGLTWTRSGVPTLLAAIAREGVELLGGPLASRIRECEGEGCALLFVDTSRSGLRRWCSMQGCGNKAKVAEFRRRQKEDAE
jgi:predicted RNA-binding Zn ribbon-like protein